LVSKKKVAGGRRYSWRVNTMILYCSACSWVSLEKPVIQGCKCKVEFQPLTLY
jgi:hypothetical protein